MLDSSRIAWATRGERSDGCCGACADMTALTCGLGGCGGVAGASRRAGASDACLIDAGESALECELAAAELVCSDVS